MQDMNWDDLRFLLALSRANTLVGAARMLGVDETTVSRRLRALEHATGLPLLQPGSGRGIALTAQAVRLAEIAAGMEERSRALDALVSEYAKHPTGTVRLTATPIIMNRLIVPNLPELAARFPHINLVLLSDGRDHDLARHMSDLALRLARPSHGGQAIVTRKVGQLAYARFAPAGRDPDQLPWITLDASLSHLPHARWLAAQQPLSGLTVSDSETAASSIAAGLGKSLLPCLPSLTAQTDTLSPFPVKNPPTRDIWLLRRRADQRDPATQAVAEWLIALCATLPGAPAL